MNSGQETHDHKGRRGRSKREEILIAATERFGRDGYEHTRWADIARDVGVGPTALYHYFESKQHCLYEIMAGAIEDFRARFARITSDEPDTARALSAVVEDWFEVDEQDMLRNRMLVAEQGLLSRHSTSRREDESRQAARARTREVEFAWASFLAAGMRGGAIPETDPRLLTHAILGLYNSIWSWYRPGGPRRARARRGVLHAADADHGGRGAEHASVGASGRMSIAAAVDGELIGGTPSAPVLLGAECRRCGTVTFPAQDSCPRCTSTDMAAARSAVAGRCGPGRSSASGRSRRPMPATKAASSSRMASAMSNSPVRSASRRASRSPIRRGCGSGWRWSWSDRGARGRGPGHVRLPGWCRRHERRRRHRRPRDPSVRAPSRRLRPRDGRAAPSAPRSPTQASAGTRSTSPPAARTRPATRTPPCRCSG